MPTAPGKAKLLLNYVPFFRPNQIRESIRVGAGWAAKKRIVKWKGRAQSGFAEPHFTITVYINANILRFLLSCRKWLWGDQVGVVMT